MKKVMCINRHGWMDYHPSHPPIDCEGPAYEEICIVLSEEMIRGCLSYQLLEWDSEEGFHAEQFVDIIEDNVKKEYGRQAVPEEATI